MTTSHIEVLPAYSEGAASQGLEAFHADELPLQPSDFGLAAAEQGWGLSPADRQAAEAYRVVRGLGAAWEDRGAGVNECYDTLLEAIQARREREEEHIQHGMAHAHELRGWFEQKILHRDQVRRQLGALDSVIAIFTALMQPHADTAHAARNAHDAAAQDHTVTAAHTENAQRELGDLMVTLGVQAAAAATTLATENPDVNPLLADYDNPRIGKKALEVGPLDTAQPHQANKYAYLVKSVVTGKVSLEALTAQIKHATYKTGYSDGALIVLREILAMFEAQRTAVQAELDDTDCDIAQAYKIVEQNLRQLGRNYMVALVSLAAEQEQPKAVEPPRDTPREPLVILPEDSEATPKSTGGAPDDSLSIEMGTVYDQSLPTAQQTPAQTPRGGRHRKLGLLARKARAWAMTT